MKYVIANFKMNKTISETKTYLMKFISKVNTSNLNLVLCLPSTSISTAQYLLKGTNVEIAGQNLCEEESGGYMGEVSGAMLKDAGATYVVVGHSDRRAKFKENARSINKKIKIALKNRLKVILCVGENLAERNTLKMLEILKNQIEEALKGLYENELENIIIAYEPIWAIGTGKIPTVKEIETSVRAIRKVIAEDFSVKAGDNISVVYGGSIDNKNAQVINKTKGLNGLLIGASCLDVDNFAQIIKQL